MSNPDQIQATTTNVFGLPATPAIDLTPTGHLPYLVAQPDTAREHPEAIGENSPTYDRDKLIAAPPDAVDESMRKALPDKYTPELAAALAACMVAELRQPSAPTACPDGVSWCLGDPQNHTDTDVHRHEGPEYGLSGSYVGGAWVESIVGFQIAQWSDGEPRLVFQGDGAWPDLGLSEVDELIGDAVPWLVQLIATRRLLAIELKPSRTPFAESEDKQTAAGAFDLATRAMDIAFDKSEDRAGTLRALRNFLDMAEAEQA